MAYRPHAYINISSQSITPLADIFKTAKEKQDSGTHLTRTNMVLNSVHLDASTDLFEKRDTEEYKFHKPAGQMVSLEFRSSSQQPEPDSPISTDDFKEDVTELLISMGLSMDQLIEDGEISVKELESGSNHRWEFDFIG